MFYKRSQLLFRSTFAPDIDNNTGI